MDIERRWSCPASYDLTFEDARMKAAEKMEQRAEKLGVTRPLSGFPPDKAGNLASNAGMPQELQ